MESRVKRFRLQARRTILRVGGAVDKSGRRSVFLTGTLPGSTQAAMREIAAWSGYIVNRLNQWLRRHKPEGEDFYAFYAWEWQKRGALHLHYCLASSDESYLSYVVEGFRAFWKGLIDDISKLSGSDCWARRDGGTWRGFGVLEADAAYTRKSVAAYLSKYVCKGSAGNGGDVSRDRYYPSRWWGCSRGLLRCTKSLTDSCSQKGSETQARGQLGEIQAVLRGAGVKDYFYRDRYGTGENYVHYIKDGLLTETWEKIKKLLTVPMRLIEGKFMHQKPYNWLPASVCELKQSSNIYLEWFKSISNYEAQILSRLERKQAVRKEDWYLLSLSAEEFLIDWKAGFHGNLQGVTSPVQGGVAACDSPGQEQMQLTLAIALP